MIIQMPREVFAEPLIYTLYFRLSVTERIYYESMLPKQTSLVTYDLYI